MTKSFEQTFFDTLIKTLESQGVRIYPELPMRSVPYPFVSVGEVQMLPKSTSSTLLGKMFVTLDVWGERNQRKDISKIMEKTLQILRVVAVEGKRLCLNVNAVNSRILSDTSTTDILWHGVLQLEFNIIL